MLTSRYAASVDAMIYRKIRSVDACFLIEVEADSSIASGTLGIVVDTFKAVNVRAVECRVVVMVHSSASGKLRCADA
jgi:hypothetical protein